MREMRISVVSDNFDCPASLTKRDDLKWSRASTDEPIPQADLYIWDCAPGPELQRSILARESAQHLVLTEANQIDALGSIQDCACILLKPVTAFTLRAFVELALKNWEARQQACEAKALRGDRDALLQYVLDVNLRLQEYDQERSNFLARALHDFRAPLTALLGYCGLLAEGKLGNVSAAQHELLDRMCYSTRRLARLAGGALEFLLQGRFDKAADRRPGDIEEAFSQALHDVCPFIADKNLHVDVQMTSPEGTLLFASEQIQQVFVNLLENSCKFSPPNGDVQAHGYSFYHPAWVESGAQSASEPGVQIPNAYRIDISDSGPGVPPDLAERIFEAYTSYSDCSDRSGAGLGLAICKAIIAAHGGTIWATPVLEGGRFSFLLPLKPSEAATHELHPEDAEVELEQAGCR